MLFKTSKEIAITGLFIALLIALQYLLSAVKGIELVTVFLLCFAYSFGPLKGFICAVGFSVLRCFVFGFFPTVLVLYLSYYPLFALAIGFLGKFFKRNQKQKSVGAFVVMIITAVIFTLLFTVIDNLITVKLSGFSHDASVTYFLASVPVMITQAVCTLLSVSVLFFPLTRIFLKVNENLNR